MSRKAIFTVLGEIITLTENVEGAEIRRHAFKPSSRAHMQVEMMQMKEGPCAVTFETRVPTRSEQQLAYHMVLMGYIARHTGYTKEEAHDAIMRLKFGTKQISLAGRVTEVRKSVAASSLFPKSDMHALIEYDLEICAQMDIRVPTKEELGYISNY